MKNLLFSIAVIFALFSCECKDQNKSSKPAPVVQQKKVAVRKTFSDSFVYDDVRHVNEKGIHYVVIYYNGVTTLNYTKDSLEIEVLKAQKYKDSLQIEVFKKYLTK